ncbi:MAG: GtrA family protein [Candidatus Pacebacteria bacterium]|nr:GtrA family protein [Candidatus Paceibacterota bacterium]
MNIQALFGGKFFQVIKSFSGGIVGLLTDLVLLKIFFYFESIPPYLSVVLAFFIALYANFLFQKHISFKYKDENDLTYGNASFFLVYWIFMSALNILLIKFFESTFYLNLFYGQIIASALMAIVSFFVYKKLIFSKLGKIIEKRGDYYAVKYGKIFFISFLARILVFLYLFIKFGEGAIVWGDSTRYLGAGESILRGVYEYGGLKEVYRTPGFPFFLSFFISLGLPVWLISIFNILLASFIPVFVAYFCSKINLSGIWKKIAISLSIFEPIMLYYSIAILPDVLFSIFLFVIIFFILKFSETRKIKFILIFSVLIGLLNYIRPVGIYMVIGIVLFLFFELKNTLFKKKIIYGIIAISIPLLVMIPWQYRNYKVFGVFEFTSALPVNLFNYAGVSSVSFSNSTPYQDTKLKLLEDFRRDAPYPSNQKDLRNSAYLKNKAKEIIKLHPVGYVKSVIAGLNTFLFSGNYHYLLMKYEVINKPAEIKSYSFIWAKNGLWGLIKIVLKDMSSPYTLIAFLGKVFWIIIIMLSIFGGLIKRKESLSMLFLIIFLYFCATILSVGIGVEARHRFALNPLIFIFSSVMMKFIYERFIRNRTTI